MSTPISTAARKLSSVLPATIASAPLWPIRSGRSRASVTLTAGGDVEADEGAHPGEQTGRGDPEEEGANRDGAAVLLLQLADHGQSRSRSSQIAMPPTMDRTNTTAAAPEQDLPEDVEPLERVLVHTGKLSAVGYLSPVIRRRIATVLLVVGAAVVALAIANVGPFSDPPTEADRAQAALEDFFAAAHRKDYKAVCRLLTAPERSQVEIRAAALAGNSTGCANVLDSPLGLVLAKTEVEITDVRVSGNLAAIDANLHAPGVKRTQYRTYKLQEIGGTWRISEVTF